MDFNLHVWRQDNGGARGKMVTYRATGISEHMSFLEMLDVVNEGLIAEGKSPIAFDHDCREGICGTCSLMINGVAHGPESSTTACQLHMRSFQGVSDVYVEPWRAKAFPVIRDLVVDRSAFDRIIQAGGYISANAGGAPDANALPIAKETADQAFEAAACIGCGACVAACKNASAMLFTSAKVGHLNSLPQGQAEADRRVIGMVEAMEAEGFGSCTNQYECEAVCPKDISVNWIAKMNREYASAKMRKRQ